MLKPKKLLFIVIAASLLNSVVGINSTTCSILLKGYSLCCNALHVFNSSSPMISTANVANSFTSTCGLLSPVLTGVAPAIIGPNPANVPTIAGLPAPAALLPPGFAPPPPPDVPPPPPSDILPPPPPPDLLPPPPPDLLPPPPLPDLLPPPPPDLLPPPPPPDLLPPPPPPDLLPPPPPPDLLPPPPPPDLLPPPIIARATPTPTSSSVCFKVISLPTSLPTAPPFPCNPAACNQLNSCLTYTSSTATTSSPTGSQTSNSKRFQHPAKGLNYLPTPARSAHAYRKIDAGSMDEPYSVE